MLAVDLSRIIRLNREMTSRVFNFNAGPAGLPEAVLRQVQSELLNFGETGMSVMEMSHRSKVYMAIQEEAKSLFKKLLNIPTDYEVLFLQGGASLQFSMIPMNLVQVNHPVDFIHTGAWTEKALEELIKVGEYRMVASSESVKHTQIPQVSANQFNPKASYTYICSNNTIFGTQWDQFPKGVPSPLVADMSSDILSRNFDITDFGLVFAGAQKNLGPSGVTVVIIKKELANRAPNSIPTMLQYRTHIKADSLYNTPPTFGIYIMGLVLKWIDSLGGLTSIEKINNDKAKVLYDFIDNSNSFYCPVKTEYRSKMNVVFRLKSKDEAAESALCKALEKKGLVGLAGHRSVGGLRASIYNAHPIEGVKALVAALKEAESEFK